VAPEATGPSCGGVAFCAARRRCPAALLGRPGRFGCSTARPGCSAAEPWLRQLSCSTLGLALGLVPGPWESALLLGSPPCLACSASSALPWALGRVLGSLAPWGVCLAPPARQLGCLSRILGLLDSSASGRVLGSPWESLKVSQIELSRIGSCCISSDVLRSMVKFVLWERQGKKF
jgi:hypothetical protein